MNAEKLREAAEYFKLRSGMYSDMNQNDYCELAADACTTLAAQMESATQEFDEWASTLEL